MNTVTLCCFMPRPLLLESSGVGAVGDLSARRRWGLFLPYRLHATFSQFRRAYPMRDQFLAARHHYDPEGVRSSFRRALSRPVNGRRALGIFYFCEGGIGTGSNGVIASSLAMFTHIERR
ncbi:MAG: hypothetical protein KDN22_08310 [Verrucomicrobiae bacterium]|nr:hypothetical protein [Verrucomicrobiae bacterium]